MSVGARVIGSGLALLVAPLVSAGTTAGASAVLPPCDETAVSTTVPGQAGSAVTTAPVTTAPVTTAPVTTAPVTTAPVTTVPVTTVPATTAPVTPSTTLLPGWVPFSSPTGDYNLAFPGEPETQTVDAPTADGGVVQITINAAEADGRAYLVSSGMIPVGGTYTLEGGRDGMVANVGGTTLCSNPIALQGWPGIEAVASVPLGGVDSTLIGRIYATDESFYQVTVVGEGTFGLTDSDVAAFFDSFRLTTAAP